MNLRVIADRYFSLIVAIFCAILMICTLYSGVRIGLADNGDFPRVMLSNKIYKVHTQDINYFYYQDYQMDVEGDTLLQKLRSLFQADTGVDYTSVSSVFVVVSKILNFIANLITGMDLSCYSLFWLAIISIVLTAFAIYLFLEIFRGRHWVLKLCACIFCVFVFCDQGYIVYFNSFYGEAIQVYALLIAVSAGFLTIMRPEKIKYGILFFAAVFFYSAAKFANIPIGILMCVVMLVISLRHFPKNSKVISVALSVVTVIFISLYSARIPVWMNAVTNYQSVFFGILKDSPNPAQDLQDLGLAQEYVSLANTTAYLTDYPQDISSAEFQKGFYERIGKLDILFYYLTHPSRFIDKINLSICFSDQIAPPYLGNTGPEFERYHLVDKFSYWSGMRRWIGADKPVLVWLFVLCVAIWLIRQLFFRRDKRGYAIFVAGLMACLLCALVMPVLGNGEADLSKHMFAYIQLFDLIFVLAGLYFIGCIRILLRKAWEQGSINRKTANIAGAILLTLIVLTQTVRFYSIGFETLEKGSYITFGEFHGKKVIWRVLDIEDDEAVLWCDTIVDYAAFDNTHSKAYLYGSNSWEDCGLRNWLNTLFLQDFSDNEIKLIAKTEHICYTSVNNRDKATGGIHPYYWVPSARFAHKDNQDAFHYMVRDDIYILSPDEIDRYVIKQGMAYVKTGDYWTRAPYYTNESMVRIVTANGLVLHKDANYNKIGVVPAVKIHFSDLLLCGKGSEAEPFTLRFL